MIPGWRRAIWIVTLLAFTQATLGCAQMSATRTLEEELCREGTGLIPEGQDISGYRLASGKYVGFAGKIHRVDEDTYLLRGEMKSGHRARSLSRSDPWAQSNPTKNSQSEVFMVRSQEIVELTPDVQLLASEPEGQWIVGYWLSDGVYRKFAGNVALMDGTILKFWRSEKQRKPEDKKQRDKGIRSHSAAEVANSIEFELPVAEVVALRVYDQRSTLGANGGLFFLGLVFLIALTWDGPL